jgi:hypothetical protein
MNCFKQESFMMNFKRWTMVMGMLACGVAVHASDSAATRSDLILILQVLQQEKMSSVRESAPMPVEKTDGRKADDLEKGQLTDRRHNNTLDEQLRLPSRKSAAIVPPTRWSAKEIGKEIGRMFLLGVVLPVGVDSIRDVIRYACNKHSDILVAKIIFVLSVAGVSPWLQKRFPSLSLRSENQLVSGALSAGLFYTLFKD